jgi:hypothetical protein
MRSKLREILEYYCGFNGTDKTLMELDEELKKYYAEEQKKPDGGMTEGELKQRQHQNKF